MRILHVTREQQADRRYGLGKSLLPVMAALEEQGHDVRYFCQGDLSPSDKATIQHQCSIWARRFAWVPTRFGDVSSVVSIIAERMLMGRFAARVAAQFNATHVHLHDPFLAAGFWRCARHLRGVQWGLTEHGFGSYAQAIKDEGIRIEQPLMQLMHAIERRVLLHAKWVAVPSPSCLQQLSRDMSLFQVPAHWHTIRHPKVQLGVTAYTAAREQLGWATGMHHVLGVGRFARMKRFPMLIEACAIVSRHQPLHLTLLGEGDSGPLLEAANRFQFVDHLTLTVTDDIGLFLSAADLYVSASSSESFGMANFEAMLAALPIVCAVGGATSDVIGTGGWLVPGDVTSLVHAISSVLQQPATAQFLRTQATKRVSGWPDAATIAQQYVQIYQLATTSGH